MEYEQRIVFFLDILGFRKIVEETEKSGEQIKKILNFINKLNSFKEDSFEESSYSKNTKQVTQFSDTLVISFKITDNGQLFNTLVEVQHILIDAISHGFLIRGGVSLGSLIHTDKILMGPALIEAYDLESSIANYPRIVISQNIIDIASQYSIDIHNEQDEKNFIKECLWLDCDGYYFIDYFDKIQCEISPDEFYIEYLDYLYNIITTGLNNKNLSVLNKYTWMKKYYNLVIDHITSKLQDYNPKDETLIAKYQSLKRI